jgi:hypothetical protein
VYVGVAFASASERRYCRSDTDADAFAAFVSERGTFASHVGAFAFLGGNWAPEGGQFVFLHLSADIVAGVVLDVGGPFDADRES